MIVNFEGKEWQLDTSEIDVRQATLIKVKTGYNLLQWQSELEQGDVSAVKALYWLMLAQNGVATDIDQVNFKMVKFIEAVGNAADPNQDDADPTTGQPTAG